MDDANALLSFGGGSLTGGSSVGGSLIGGLGSSSFGGGLGGSPSVILTANTALLSLGQQMTQPAKLFGSDEFVPSKTSVR